MRVRLGFGMLAAALALASCASEYDNSAGAKPTGAISGRPLPLNSGAGAGAGTGQKTQQRSEAPPAPASIPKSEPAAPAVAAAPSPAPEAAPAADAPAVASLPPETLPDRGAAVSASSLSTSEAGLALIRAEEALRLEAYQGLNGEWLIGYGHRSGPGEVITEAQAEAYLIADCREIEQVISNWIDVPVTQGEFDAMVSLTYSIGTGRFRDSTVLARLNAGDRQGAADAFLLWVKIRRGGELVASVQLTERRNRERALFLGTSGTGVS